MEMYNVKKNIIHILYKIYIFKTWANLKLQKNQSRKIWTSCVSNFSL